MVLLSRNGLSSACGDLAQLFLILSAKGSTKSTPAKNCATPWENHTVLTRSFCAYLATVRLWPTHRVPYAISTLAEAYSGTDLEILQAIMKVVLCTGM